MIDAVRKRPTTTEIQNGDFVLLSLLPERVAADDDVVIGASDYLRSKYSLYHIPELVLIGPITDDFTPMDEAPPEVRQQSVLVGVRDSIKRPDGSELPAQILCRHLQAPVGLFKSDVARITGIDPKQVEALWLRTEWFSAPPYPHK